MRAAIEEMFQSLDEDGDFEDTTCVAMEKEEEDLMLLDDGTNFFRVVPTGTGCPHLIFSLLYFGFRFLLFFFITFSCNYFLFYFFTFFLLQFFFN